MEFQGQPCSERNTDATVPPGQETSTSLKSGSESPPRITTPSENCGDEPRTPPMTPRTAVPFQDRQRSTQAQPIPLLQKREARPQERNKKGFRIDDILFSVANNAERKLALKITTSSPFDPPPSVFSPPTSKSPTSSITSNEGRSRSPLYMPSDNRTTYAVENDSYKRLPQEASMVTKLSTRRDSLSASEDGETDQSSSHDREDGRGAKRYGASSPEYHEDCELPLSPGNSDTKKPRTSFTPDQIQTLEETFTQKRYLNHTDRMILADELGLTDCQIKTWFQNRRMKMKRQYKEAVEKGYLIPFHPYPFPRYSRLTPAHFASAPAVQPRYFYSGSRSQSSPGCNCCSGPSRHYPVPYHSSSIDSERRRYRSRSPEVLPTQRHLEFRESSSMYEKELREYFDTRLYSNSTVKTRI